MGNYGVHQFMAKDEARDPMGSDDSEADAAQNEAARSKILSEENTFDSEDEPSPDNFFQKKWCSAPKALMMMTRTSMNMVTWMLLLDLPTHLIMACISLWPRMKPEIQWGVMTVRLMPHRMKLPGQRSFQRRIHSTLRMSRPRTTSSK